MTRYPRFPKDRVDVSWDALWRTLGTAALCAPAGALLGWATGHPVSKCAALAAGLGWAVGAVLALVLRALEMRRED